MPIEGTTYSISHTYSTTGTKSVKNVVTDPYSGASGTGTTSITIAAPLSVASFTASPTSGPVPLTVTFTIGTISGGFPPYSGTLNYGDGSSDPVSAAGTKTHTYTTKGTFTATLTVTDSLGATISGTVTTYAGTYPACPIWMNTIHAVAVKNGLTRLQQGLETLAESRKCSLT
jgi:PKD repeat protein